MTLVIQDNIFAIQDEVAQNTSLLKVILGLLLLIFLLPLRAAPFNIPAPFLDSDIITNGVGVTYDYTGSGGMLTIFL